MSSLVGQREMTRKRISAIFAPRRLIVAAGGLLVVFILTHIPQAMMPKQFQGNIIDKLEHTAAYGTIALLFIWAFRRPPGMKALLVLLLVGMVAGALDEITQPLVNRIASMRDFAADSAGIVLVCAICLLMRRCRRNHRGVSTIGT